MLRLFIVLTASALLGATAHGDTSGDTSVDTAHKSPWIFGPGHGHPPRRWQPPPPRPYFPPPPGWAHHRPRRHHHHGGRFWFQPYPYPFPGFFPYPLPYERRFRLWYCSARGETWRGQSRTVQTGGYSSLREAERVALRLCRERGYRHCRVVCWSR